jgi:hypothetical protein
VRFADGVSELIEWVRRQQVREHRDVNAELAARGLVR